MRGVEARLSLAGILAWEIAQVRFLRNTKRRKKLPHRREDGSGTAMTPKVRSYPRGVTKAPNARRMPAFPAVPVVGFELKAVPPE